MRVLVKRFKTETHAWKKSIGNWVKQLPGLLASANNPTLSTSNQARQINCQLRQLSTAHQLNKKEGRYLPVEYNLI